MQRIDENTYIDDTLVTCAEYQLFIDEMHEQGKYYQPDHWTSHQFSKGKARDPILGVRHSDAVAFCKWLTQAEDGKWDYRLPTQEEAKQFLIKAFGQIPLGYWVNEKLQFVWMDTIPKDPRKIDLIRSRVLARTRSYSIQQEINHALNRARNRDILDFTTIPDRDIVNQDAINRALDSALDRVTSLLYRGNARAIDLINPDFDRNRAQAINHAIDLCVDIFTLQERIAGRSPAFEGIRLVKDRIK